MSPDQAMGCTALPEWRRRKRKQDIPGVQSMEGGGRWWGKVKRGSAWVSTFVLMFSGNILHTSDDPVVTRAQQIWRTS